MAERFAPRPVPAPGELRLDAGTLDVWFAPLGPLQDRPWEELASLTDAEARRADGMAAAPRGRFVATRALLRKILAAYLHADPKSLELAYGARGKPRLAGAHELAGLHFNVSHSGQHALLAFGQTPHGVDLEAVRPLRDPEALARRFFAPSEREALAAVPAEARLQAFFACWTRKEAYLKAAGTGIATSLRSFAVPVAPGPAPALLAATGRPDARWTLRLFEPQDGLVGALAHAATVRKFRCWRRIDRAGAPTAQSPISSMNRVS